MSKLLPRGTVTLLLADVEGSTWLWETHPDDMGAAVARLDKAVSGVIAAHDGVRPVEQGEGDSFVLAFACASDAVAAALDLQAYVTADLRHHPADEHCRASQVALIDVAHWASEFPWCGQAAEVLRSHFGASLPVRVCTICTDPWNLDHETGRDQA